MSEILLLVFIPRTYKPQNAHIEKVKCKGYFSEFWKSLRCPLIKTWWIYCHMHSRIYTLSWISEFGVIFLVSIGLHVYIKVRLANCSFIQNSSFHSFLIEQIISTYHRNRTWILNASRARYRHWEGIHVLLSYV